MPRTLPSEFIELEGKRNVYAPVLLMEWHLNSGTRYFSSGDNVTWNGASWEGNRLTAPTVTFGVVDAEHREFPKITLNLDNLPASGESAFPFQAIDASEVFEDKLVVLYVYSPDKETGFEFWRGRSLRPTYNGTEKTVDLNLSFIFDSLFLPVPSQGLPQAGFTISGVETNQDDLNPSSIIPLYYGVGNKKIRPVIYRFENGGAWAYVNFIVSGCAPGLPFDPDDIINLKLFDTIKAQEVVFHPGGTDTTPHNLTKFPDGSAHDDIAYGFALFPWDNKDQDLQPDSVRGTIANGRPLIDTGLPSENLPLIIKDLLRDPNHGLGAPDSDFDNDALAETADYTGTRYQARLELREQQPLIDLIQKLLGECHCYIAWPNGQIQIRAKRNDEAASATFATINSGQSGILIEDDIENVEEKSFDEIPNQLKVDFRLANRHKAQPFFVRDRAAQLLAGGNYQKVSQDEVEFIALFDVEQAKISGAIRLREGLQGNIYVRFRTPFYDSLRVVHGDLANVYGKDVPNNASNYVFRVLTETWSFGEVPYREFYCKLYKPATYNRDYAGLDIDLERTGTDTSQSGRPDDVTPVSLAVSDPVEGDTGGKLTTITATCTIPAFDPTDEIAEGIHRLPPIAAWEAWWHYTDESPNLWRRGTTKEVAQADTAFDSSGDFQLDFYKNRSIEVVFIALPPSRARSKLGYIPDPTKATHLMADLTAIAASASVDDATVFAGAQYAICEFEVDKITGTGVGSVSFDVDGSGHRKPYFESTAIAHPDGTQIAVAKLSYPSLTVALSPPRFTYPFVTAINVLQRPDGVKIKITDISAENTEDYGTYYTTNASYATDPTKLGSDNPAWYAADPLSPPVGINLILGKALHFTIPQEDIGAAGTVVYAASVARNGKHNWSSKLSPRQSSAVGDDGVPVLATAPALVPKQIGLRVKCPLPTLNMKTFPTAGKVEVVLQARDGSNAVLGYVTESGTTFGTQVGEYKFDFGLTHTHTFNLKRGDLLTLFPTIVTLKVYYYVTNAVGTSAASPVSSLTVATWEADAMQIDTTAPSGLNQPVLHAQKGSFVAKKMYATANDNQEQYKEVVFAVVTDAGALVNYVDAVNRAATASEATAKINIGTSGHYTLQMRADEMISAFGGPTNRNLKVYYYVTNLVGTSLASASSALLPFASFNTDPIEKDTTAPTVPAAPTVIPGQAKIKVKTARPTTQLAQLVKCEIVARVKNGGGAVIGYVIDGTTPTNSATEYKNDIGPHLKDTFHWKRSDILALYPTAATIEFYNYVTNEIATSAASAATALNVSTWEVDPMAPDSVAPSGLNQPVLHAQKGSFVAKKMYATANDNQEQYKEVVFAVADDGGALINYVDAVNRAATASEATAKINIGTSGHYTLQMRADEMISAFGGPTNRNLKVYYYVTNLVGTSLKSTDSSLLPFANFKADPVEKDTTVPTIPAAPTVIPSSAKIKVKTKAPTSQIAVLVKVEIVARVKNGSGTVLGYIIDGTTPTNNVTEFKNDNGLHFKDTFNWKRADIIALYPTATTIEFYNYVTNEIGSSAASAATALNVSTWEVDPLGDDTAAPSGLTTPTIKKLKKAGLRIVLTAPTSGNLKLRKASVYIANGTHATATLWVSAADLTASTATEANGAIEAPPSGGHTVTVDRATLEAIFGTGGTITVYATWTNDIGASGFSSGATYNLTTGEPGAVDQDTAVPSSLGTPTLVYIARQGVHIEGLIVGANWNTPTDKWVVIYNGSSTYFDLAAYMSSGGATVQGAASEAAARYRIGPGKGHTPFGIKLYDLKQVFGFTNPTNTYAYFYAANAKGTSSKSSDSAALNLYTAKDIMGATDGVRVLDVAATMMSPGQLLGNGDALLVDNTNDQQYSWARWDGLTTPLPAIGGTGYKVITSTTNEIAYVSSTDSLWLKANSTWLLIQNVKRRIKAGQPYALTFMLRAASAITVTVKLHLYNLSRAALTGTANATSSTAVVGSGTLFLSEVSVGDQIVISSQKRTVQSITDNTHLTVTSAFSAASGAINVIIDNINDTINKTINLTTSYQLFEAVISMKNSPNLASTPGGTDYANHQFGVEITGNTQDVYDDYFMLVRGQQPMMFAPRGDETENFNTGAVPTYISTPDIVPISGTQGGSYLKDSGGFLNLQ